jgi:serine/threonine protein kinase
MNSKVLRGRQSTYLLESDVPAFLGRLAILYRATDAKSGQDVLLKVFREEIAEPGAIASFYAELEALQALRHPNVLPILDYGEQNIAEGRGFLVTPYCRGGNLHRLLGGVQFVPLALATPLLRQIAAAIDHAHSHGVIHGDIKPQNILLSEDRRTCFLADFGVARHFAVMDLVSTIAPSDKVGAGTSAYLSPEQLSENKQSTSSDVYAFGLVAYELLTGRLPFDTAAPPFQQMLARVEGQLVDARGANPVLPRQVSAALMQALAVDPGARPRSATALCELLSPARKWDIFIAYASSDREQADALFRGLSTKWRVFLDHQRLLPGDNWDAELAAAQRDSLVTVVLVSSRTETAYYQREEVAAAIDLARRNPDSHRVVPVYLGPTAAETSPYGLRIKQGLRCEDPRRMEPVITELNGLLATLTKRSKPGS